MGNGPAGTVEEPGHDALIPRSKYLFVAAAAVIVLSVCQVTGVIQLPLGGFLSGSSTSVLSTSSLLDFMSTAGYASLFALMSLESASVPIPSEVVLPFAGYLVSLGRMDFAVAVAVSTVAGLAGALVDYYLAYFLGRPFVVSMLRTLRINTRDLDRAERWFDRSGQWTVFAARFVPVLRSVISLPAGLFRMRLLPFMAMTVIGCAGWSAVLIYAGYAAGGLWNSIFSSSVTLVNGFSAVAGAAAALYVGYFIKGVGKK